MRLYYIPMIQKKLKLKQKLVSKNKTDRLIDGSYESIYMGRSLDFENLREYVPGDEVKDIDWKSSARGTKIYVREYIAERKHNILLIVDSCKAMGGESIRNETKRQVAIMCAGIVACYANKNGDYVGAVYERDDYTNVHPFKTSLYNIEDILAGYDSSEGSSGAAGVGKSAEYVLKNIRRKMIVFIITDEEGMIGIDDSTLRSLASLHTVMALIISDTDIHGKNVLDKSDDKIIPTFISQNKKLVAMEQSERNTRSVQCVDKCKGAGIEFARVDSESDIEQLVAGMLGRKKGANKR